MQTRFKPTASYMRKTHVKNQKHEAVVVVEIEDIRSVGPYSHKREEMVEDGLQIDLY